MSSTGPARPPASAIPGNQLGAVMVQRATPEQRDAVRERLRRINQTAAERGISPAGVAGLTFLSADILRCQDDPELVQQLQAAIGVTVGDHDAIVATAVRWLQEAMATRPTPAA